MKFNADTHRCAIVIDKKISSGLAINAASVIAISLGKNIGNLVGKDLQSHDHRHYPGVIYSPLPILTACEAHIKEIFASAEEADDIYIMPFSSLAQSCKTYDEYEGKIASVSSENIQLVAVGLVGAKKKITAMIGSLPLYK